MPQAGRPFHKQTPGKTNPTGETNDIAISIAQHKS